MKSLQHQGWQRELVDQIRLVPFAEVTQVLVLRNVGFGNETAVRRMRLENSVEQADNAMRLGQVNATRPRFLPQVGDRVQPQQARTGRHVLRHHVNDLKQDFRVVVIEVQLVIAECGPDPATLRVVRQRGNQRGRPWPNNSGRVHCRIHHVKPGFRTGIARPQASR